MFCKKRCFFLLGVLTLLLLCLIQILQLRKSPYQDSTLVSEFAVLSEQAQYTADTEKISLCIQNHGDTAPELYLPYLEQDMAGTWVALEKSASVKDTDQLLCIPAGETENVEFYLTDYESLSAGKYRVIFRYAGSTDFFSFPFEIVEP